jgi:hypothetical protein
MGAVVERFSMMPQMIGWVWRWSCCTKGTVFSRAIRNHVHNLLRFEVLMGVSMVLLFWILVPFRLADRCHRFGEKYCFRLQPWRETNSLHLQGWRWKQYVSPKWRLPSSLNVAKSLKNAIIRKCWLCQKGEIHSRCVWSRARHERLTGLSERNSRLQSCK